ncbi:hypothetical protein G3T36_17300 [Diaminobutyricibacter tongyongensis]|uniref:Uncharacterized protein n=1 Tax=Leifsonia tongyongensis TaxID=1268043 RepID=A0A6L9Y216_9MICO|nr:hypothetical protein [Diaminobutyricibacter tongyongensis]NEN07616.1 hypothetical protein [Diaminobutyricibacter tongyongensis]
MTIQKQLAAEYGEAMQAVREHDNHLAQTISLYVSALRTECASRRVEASELHALLNGVTGGHDGHA